MGESTIADTVIAPKLSLYATVDRAIARYPFDSRRAQELLTGAGFTVTGTRRWGLAFVCRINGLPTVAADPCVNTPSATAYWSYWHGTPGGTWTFSGSGASGYDPAPGTVEGWAFGSGSAPTTGP